VTQPLPGTGSAGDRYRDDADVVVPDTKDWTWVIERRCPECGFAGTDVEPAGIAAMVRRTADRWSQVLAADHDQLRRRPRPGTWSPLEYACHVRDVHEVFAGRVALMLGSDDPLFANWDQDAAAIAGRYREQPPAAVRADLLRAAERAAAQYDAVTGDAWQQPGRRSNGSTFTVASIGRYHLHDVVHHLHDVGAGGPAAAP
jgi:hypothetical protein